MGSPSFIRDINSNLPTIPVRSSSVAVNFRASDVTRRSVRWFNAKSCICARCISWRFVFCRHIPLLRGRHRHGSIETEKARHHSASGAPLGRRCHSLPHRPQLQWVQNELGVCLFIFLTSKLNSQCSDREDKELIDEAIAIYESMTCLTFRKRSGDRNYVQFISEPG